MWKGWFALIATVIALVVDLHLAAAQPTVGRRVALVIGNGGYEGAWQLDHPASDAQAVAERLREIGFEIVGSSDGGPVIDADFRTMYRAIATFSAAAEGAELALLYYAGQGFKSVNGRNYLMPVGSETIARPMLQTDFIGLGDLVVAALPKAAHLLAILDVCRELPPRDVRHGVPMEAFRVATALPNSELWYAAGCGSPTEDSRSGAPTVFAGALLSALGQPGSGIRATFDFVHDRVVQQTGYDQIPTRVGNLSSVTLVPEIGESVDVVESGVAAVELPSGGAATDVVAPSPAPGPVASVATPAGGDGIAEPGRRIALVIGNARYSGEWELVNPAIDAQRIAARLEALGFEIVGGGPVLDADEDAMDDAIRALSDAMPGAELALLYYAGHGIQDPASGGAYLVPVGAEEGAPLRLRHMIGVDALMEQLAPGGATRVWVIFDACRNVPGPVMRGLDSRWRFRGAEAAVPDMMVWYAAQRGAPANEGAPGEMSPFAQSFLDMLAQPGVATNSEAFGFLRAGVQARTQGVQRPDTSGYIDPVVLVPGG